MNETTKKPMNFESFVGLAMAAGKAEREHLESVGDTHFRISWEEFLDIAKAYGFKCGFCQKFIGTGYFDEDVEEEEVIFFHEEKGLILHAESYNGKTVNSAKVYGEVKINDVKFTEKQLEALDGCSYGSNKNGTLHFDVNVNIGFRFHLDAISEAFEFSRSWSKVPFIWLLNYIETRTESSSYEEINKRKIDACLPTVRKIIFG